MKTLRRKIVIGVFALCAGGLSLLGCRSFIASRLQHDFRYGAMEHLRVLKSSGLLPGFDVTEKGEFTMSADKILLGVGEKYPFKMTIFATKTTQEGVYYYELLKETADSEWQLASAWLEKGGKTLKLPLKKAATSVE